ncbi:MAG: hypothetical protein AAGJ95_11850 [Cyanobacteria bacterium J06554_11]
MTTFDTSDRGRIVDALGLHEELNRPNSALASLMTTRQTDDTAYSVDRVGDIVTALDEIETLDVSLSADTSPGISSENIENDYSVTYATGDANSGVKRRRSALVGKIKRWLDPDQRLEAYTTAGRVIRTL